MGKYEIVDPNTGELVEFETPIDIGLLEEYNRWVIDSRLNPPSYSPQEYALYLESEVAKRQLAKAREMVEFYTTGPTIWSSEMLESLLRILRNEE